MGQDDRHSGREADRRRAGTRAPAARVTEDDDAVMADLDEFVRGARIDADMAGDRRALDAQRGARRKPDASAPKSEPRR